MGRYFRQFERVLLKVEAGVLVAVLLAMLGLSFAQVVLRNFFDSGLSWADPLNRYGVLWIAFLGSAIAAAERRHLSIDVLTKTLPARLVRPISGLVGGFSLVVCYLLARASLAFLKQDIAFSGHRIAFIPAWTLEVIIPLGFVLLFFHIAMRLFEKPERPL